MGLHQDFSHYMAHRWCHYLGVARRWLLGVLVWRLCWLFDNFAHLLHSMQDNWSERLPMNLKHYINKFCRIVVNGRREAHFGRIREVYNNVIIFEATNGDRFWIEPSKIDEVITTEDCDGSLCMSNLRTTVARPQIL